MCFAPGWWSWAVGETAPAIAGGECDSLSWGEPALFVAHVDGLAVGVELHRHDSCFADVSFDRVDADRHSLAIDMTGASPSCEVVFGDEHPDRRTVSGENSGVYFGAEADELDEGIECELFGGALVAHQILGAG
jgi:hypothetical protein